MGNGKGDPSIGSRRQGLALASSHSRFPIPDSRLDHLRRVWERLGDDDPLWAVLSDPRKRGGRWDVEEFFATGAAEIDAQLAAVGALGFPRERGLALDFGCGAGRLTQRLAAHFRHAIGIDVSTSMVATARKLGAGLDNIEFRVNASPRIEGIADASVDFVGSHITLQHIPAELAIGYVEEFFRILAPGGVAVFQFVADTDDSLRGRIFGAASNRWLNPLRRIAWRRRDVFEMHALQEDDLRALLATRPSLRLANALDEASAGPGWHGRRWIVVNDAPSPVAVTHDGLVLYADPADAHIGAPLIAGVAHDAHVAAFLREQLRDGDVVLDIGANIGSLALVAAQCVGASGRVIAIEPLARNRVLLARAAQANGFGQIEMVAAAASDHAGELALRTHPATSNAATPDAAGPRLRAAGGETLRVPAVVLDDMLDLPRLDLVKIDVSGMEPLALRGLERHLQRHRPLLVSEFHPQALRAASGIEAIDFLRWLRRFYPAITVLHRDGRRERCADEQGVIDAWRTANAAAGLDGSLHLDIALARE